MMVNAFNAITQEAEACGSLVSPRSACLQNESHVSQDYTERPCFHTPSLPHPPKKKVTAWLEVKSMLT